MNVLKRQDCILTTARLSVIPPVKSDFLDWVEARDSSRPHLKPWEPRWSSGSLSRKDWNYRLKNWKKQWQDGRGYAFLLRRIDTGRLVGGATLSNVRSWPANTGTLGYWLTADAEGYGYMTEAVTAVCDWAFQHLYLSRVEAAILPENGRSRRVLERTGFLEEGYAKSYLEINGLRQDHVLFAKIDPNSD